MLNALYAHQSKAIDGKMRNFLQGKNHPHFVPILDKLYFFNESDIFPGQILEEKFQKLEKLLGDPMQYEIFLQQKARRPNYDMYACFQPFNEASKALYPFFKKLRATVQKGDAILNLWDRSGWITALLAGLFPDNEILTTWEGNKDVLGYKGYNFWLQERDNVRVMFCDLDEPLPLADNSIAFSVGLDTFHRFNQGLLLKELMRVVKDNGAIIFPHVHLTNNEPDPWFERGCKQMHGMDYDRAFSNFPTDSNWKGYVFSEPYLFAANEIHAQEEIPLLSTPDQKDYNSLIAVLPKAWRGENLSAFSMNDLDTIDDCFVIINLLLNIDLHHQKVRVDHDYLNGSVGYLLDRHPIYIERIKALDNQELSLLATQITYLATHAYSVKEMQERLGCSPEELHAELAKLEKLGMLQVLPVSREATRLQYHLMSQEYLVPKAKQNLKSLWQHVVKAFPENHAIISLEDESEFTFEDCEEVVEMIMLGLQSSGLNKGDKIIIAGNTHTEAIMLCWACMQLGIVVVPIGGHLPEESIQHILTLTSAKTAFLTEKVYREKGTFFRECSIVLFDEEDQAENANYFEDWLEEIEEESVLEVEIKATDEAFILFTSGSTGMPKGVQLSHGNLFRSGRLITETFQWEEDDRLFAIGGLESMSGLRNTIIAPLHVGASVVVPQAKLIGNLFGIAEAVEESKATVMSSNPALLHQFAKYAEKIRGQLDSIRCLICTGNALSQSLRKDFKTAFGKDILNYYGLTETTGICISQSPLDEDLLNDSIGKPIDCIAQIVDESGKPVAKGEEGELRIYSENIMQGYLAMPKKTTEVIRNGWFYTHDRARYTENGNIQLLGRIRNIVKISSGEVVYLKEIQDVIGALDKVEDVFCYAYEEEDAEKIAACIVLKDPENDPAAFRSELRQILLSQLGERKIPRRINFLPHLPYSDNGKLSKKELLDALQ
ncbi:MAG: class I adenylate-forming enzyme family protein [Bacteroidota bacterium]